MSATVQNATDSMRSLAHDEHGPPATGYGPLFSIRNHHPYQEIAMNKDQVKGRIDEAKGKVKEVAGKVAGNKELELKGKIQNTGGKIQAGFGDMKKDLKKAG